MFKHLLPFAFIAAMAAFAAGPVLAQSEASPPSAPVYDPQGRVIPYDVRPEAAAEAAPAPPAAKSRHAKHAKKSHKVRKPRAHAKAKSPKKKAAAKSARKTSRKTSARKTAKPRPH